jgi:hypothetical protein
MQPNGHIYTPDFEPSQRALVTHKTGSCVGPSDDLDVVQKRKSVDPFENRAPIPRPSSSYPSHYNVWAVSALPASQ